MGKLEQKSSKKSKKKNLQQIVLSVVTGAGILAVGMLAPNVIGAMAKLGILPNKRQGEYVRSSASKLVERGLLKFNGKFYEMTHAGRELMCRWSFRDFKLKKPKKWDKKWRLLIFDIPEKKRVVRNHITLLFRKAGFYRLQNSVWVYPYDCEDVITILKTDFGVGKNLLYLIVDEIENDKHLREEFSLIK